MVGAHVVLVCCIWFKVDTARDSIFVDVGLVEVMLVDCDLLLLVLVGMVVDDVWFWFDWFDLLVNNVGVMVMFYGCMVDGFELQFVMNYFGYVVFMVYLLFMLLVIEWLWVVNISSFVYCMGCIDFDDL